MRRTARESILSALRKPPAVCRDPLPAYEPKVSDYQTLAHRFEQSLELGYGKLVLAGGELIAAIDSLPAVQSSKRLCSSVPGVARQAIEPAALTSPHAAAVVDVAVVHGEFGVAENGSVWVTDRQLRQRSLLFVVEHLVLVLDPLRIVATMQEAYRGLELSEERFGCFICGPSKTADIEQSLVVGAHGPRSLTVVGVEQPRHGAEG